MTWSVQICRIDQEKTCECENVRINIVRGYYWMVTVGYYLMDVTVLLTHVRGSIYCTTRI